MNSSLWIKKLVPAKAKKLYQFLRTNTPHAKAKLSAHSAALSERIKRTETLIKLIYQNNSPRVLNGPFRGMKYISSSNGSQLLPKLMGSYEEPIHRWIYDILEYGNYTTVLDVGCAEGYYAVGLAKAKSKPQLLAFDIDLEALHNANTLAKKNGVSESIRFHREFGHQYVSEILENDCSENVLIFMDVEGAEIELLNTNTGPVLLSCDILVELHDCFYPGITEKVVGYFSDTHTIEIILDYPWRSGHYSFDGKEISQDDVEFMFDERRPRAMRWMYAKRK